jgi:hypothetical protein
MLIVSVHLHSAITGKVSEIARMQIVNDGTGVGELGHYRCRSYRGRDTNQLNNCTISRQGEVKNYQRRKLHVWNLVARSLERMGYGWPGIER